MAEGDVTSTSRRLAHFDAELGDLKATVAGLSTAFSVFKEDQRTTLQEVRELNRALQQKSQTHWPTVISGLSLVVVVGGLSLLPIKEKLVDFRTSQRRQWDVIRSHMAEDGHPPMQIRVGALEKAVDRTRQEIINEIKNVDADAKDRDRMVDEVVQREMRILDQAMQNRFDKEDERLQREMDLKDSIVSEGSIARYNKLMVSIRALEKAIKRIEGEQDKRASRVYSTGADSQ